MTAYTLGSHEFTSRLIIGSGKYESFEQNLACAEASGAEKVTVALRRTKFDAPKGQGLLDGRRQINIAEKNRVELGRQHAAAFGVEVLVSALVQAHPIDLLAGAEALVELGAVANILEFYL